MNQHVRQPSFSKVVKASAKTTTIAKQTTFLTPRFYTTDFDSLDQTDIRLVREDWDILLEEMRADPNRAAFQSYEPLGAQSFDDREVSLRKELIDFFVSSLSAAFSASIFYKEIKRRGKNPDLRALFSYISRDEARHAGFLSHVLKELDVTMELDFLAKPRKYTYLRPKFMFYASYLSENMCSVRYAMIDRHLQKHPDGMFHPIFKVFGKWSGDELRHAEAFSLLLRANPKLTQGANILWIKFYLVWIFTTIYMRDHTRSTFFEALGLDVHEFNFKVFEMTSNTSRHCLPITLDLNHRAFPHVMKKLNNINQALGKVKNKRGLLAWMQKGGYQIVKGIYFARLLFIPSLPSKPVEKSFAETESSYLDG